MIGHLQIYDLYSSTFIIRLKVDRDGRRKVVCKKCSFSTEKLEKLNTHAKKIHVVHNVGKAPDEKPRTTPRTGFHTRETFDEIIDELETRDPPVDIRIVISAIITKPTVTKRRKKQTAKHSFEFMILDATEA